jgi:AbiU2
MGRHRKVTITRAAAVQRLNDMIPLIEQNVRIGLEVEAALEVANDIIKPYTGVPIGGAQCYNTVKSCMALNLALTLARLFDPAGEWEFPRSRTRKRSNKWKHPNKSDVALIPLLVRLLKQKRCRAVLVEEARNWTPGFMEDQQATCCAAAIDDAIAAYAQLRNTREGRSALETLRQFRNKKLAHTLMGAVLGSLPRYDQLFLLMDVARDVTEKADLAIRGRNLSLSDLERIRRHGANCFWRPAIEAAAEAPA